MNGMYVEMSEFIESQSALIDTSYWNAILNVYQADVDGSLSFSCYKENVPFELVELFMSEVRRRLLNTEETQSDNETSK